MKFRTLLELLACPHSYIEYFKIELDRIEPGLWAKLETVPALVPKAQNQVVTYFLELALRCQNNLNIELGRAGLLALPREWLVLRLLTDLEPFLLLEEEWEYRRLLEVVHQLDKNIFSTMIAHGLGSSNSEIRETALEIKSWG